MTLRAKWVDQKREPTQPANPGYPDGIDIDLSRGLPITCECLLQPYPAPRCGLWIVTCPQCKQNAVITTAGRRDDPRSVKLACRKPRGGH